MVTCMLSPWLQGVKEQMEVMKDKDMLLSVRNASHQKLLDELDNIVVSVLGMKYAFLVLLELFPILLHQHLRQHRFEVL